MHYLIYGTGAVGSYLGGLLNLSGVQTTFLARPRISSVLEESGLHIVGDDIQSHLTGLTLSKSPKEALNQPPPDVILLTVKAYDAETSAKEIREHTPHPIPILCFTNGVGSEAILSSLLPKHMIHPATTTTAVQLKENGLLEIARKRGVGLAGTHSILDTIYHDFTRAGMYTRRYKHAERMKWSKLLTNIVSNATSAITGWSPQEVFSHPGLCQLEVEAVRETVRVMRAKGIAPVNLPKVPVSLLSFGIFLPVRITQNILGSIVTKGRGSKRPSFHYDIGRNRSEVKWLNGAVVMEGEQLGLPTPANHVLTEIMLTLIENAEKHEQFRHRPNQLLHRAEKAGVPGIQGYNP